MNKSAIAAAAWCAAWSALGWRDAAAGAWLGIGAIALAPAAIVAALALRRRERDAPASDVEAQAWSESGWGGGRAVPLAPARAAGPRIGPRPATALG
jgi:hypothetical protein